MFLRKGLFGVLGTTLVLGTMAFAQQPQPATPSQEGTQRRDQIERLERRRERMGQREGRLGHRGVGRERAGRLLRELNLSEEQRHQQRAIVQRRLESTKAQREELFRLREKRIAGTFSAEDEARAKALHQEIRTAMQGVRSRNPNGSDGGTKSAARGITKRAQSENGATHAGTPAAPSGALEQ